MSRYFSTKRMEFFVPGRVSAQGRPRGSKNGVRIKTSQYQGQREYRNILNLYIKAAMAEWKFEPNPEEGVYVVLTINVRPDVKKSKQRQAEEIKSKEIAICAPNIQKVFNLFKKSLKETGVIKNDNQIVAATLAKLIVSEDREGLDVLIGVPTTWRELNNDLRNS